MNGCLKDTVGAVSVAGVNVLWWSVHTMHILIKFIGVEDAVRLT